MAAWDREFDLGARAWGIVAIIFAITVLAWVVLLGSRARSEPVRCRTGFLAMGARCCAPGQGISKGACVGTPDSCPAPYQLTKSPTPGCILPAERIWISGGEVTLGPTDWDSVAVVKKHTISVRGFWMDRSEIDMYRYHECEKAGLCEPLPYSPEPGIPVTGVSMENATAFCAFVGGHVPTPAQWVFSAAGTQARRFPWGPHGLVCRRAVFGLVHGPCAQGATSAELAGMRPHGKSPEGLLDLAGNAEELTLGRDGTAYYYGGSYRSQSARALKVWSQRQGEIRDDTGFRCAYEKASSSP